MSCPYHHCGITTSGDVTREGHCYCPECHAGPEEGFPASRIIRAGLPVLPGNMPPRATMCDRWYTGTGDYRPWQRGRPDGCLCGVSPHALPGQHGTHCPVRQRHDRVRWQGAEPGGAETWAP